MVVLKSKNTRVLVVLLDFYFISAFQKPSVFINREEPDTGKSLTHVPWEHEQIGQQGPKRLHAPSSLISLNSGHGIASLVLNVYVPVSRWPLLPKWPFVAQPVLDPLARAVHRVHSALTHR